jgi:mono/diheme cytochrome c family protein
MRVMLLSAAGVLVYSSSARAQSDGAKLFQANCAACHGKDGSGDTAIGHAMKIRDLRSADVQKETDNELTAMITVGKDGMPAYKSKLTASQIKDLVGYIRELGKSKAK